MRMSHRRIGTFHEMKGDGWGRVGAAPSLRCAFGFYTAPGRGRPVRSGTGPPPPAAGGGARLRAGPRMLLVPGTGDGADALVCGGQRAVHEPAAARAIGSAGERLVHTEEVTGSIPVSPTQVKGRLVPRAGPARSSPGPTLEYRPGVSRPTDHGWPHGPGSITDPMVQGSDGIVPVSVGPLLGAE